MKVNPDWPASPCPMRQTEDNEYRPTKPGDPTEYIVSHGGMSIRTELAARAMEGVIAGMLSNPKIKIGKPGELERSIAKAATKMADALIAELNKPTE